MNAWLLVLTILLWSVTPSHAQLSPFAHIGGVGLVSTQAPVQWEHPLAQGLLSMWRIIPGLEGGRQWYDLAGVHHGTLTNGAAWGATVRGGGFGEVRLDGATTYVDVGLTSDYYSGAQTMLTASAWVQPTASTLTAVTPRIFSFQRSVGSIGWALQLSTSTGLLEARYRDAANTAVTLTGITALDTGWHLGTVVYASSVMTLYLDGKQEATATDVDSANTFPAGAAPAVLGAFDGSALVWGGGMDDLRLYTRALSPLEVAGLYALGRQGDTGLLNRGPLFTMGALPTTGFFYFMQ